MISPETILLVRERTDIVAVIQESVPTLKRKGRVFVGLCPFHKERTPSFQVNQERGFFHCFGCKESGSVLDFVMKHDGLTFPEAVRLLAERGGIEVVEDTGPRTDADRLKKQRDDLFAVNHVAATFFEEQLRAHPHGHYAVDELAHRGIAPDNDAVGAFRIGYAPSGWDGLATYLRAQGVSASAAEQVGLLVPRSGGSGHYDRFRHRLMFAVMDVQGRVVAFSGRALAPVPEEREREGAKHDPPPKYINSPESPIYSKGQSLFGLHQGRQAIRQTERAILVEGNFDVVALHARGMQNVVAPLGTAFTADQAKLLLRFAPYAVFLFDADAAGQKAVRASRDACRKTGLVARVGTLPRDENGVFYKDPDELARARGIGAVEECVARARGMLEHLLEQALDETFAAADAYERAARLEHVGRLLAEEDDPLVRSIAKTHADYLASRLDVVRVAPGREAFRALEQNVRTALRAAPPRPEPRPEPRAPADGRDGREERAREPREPREPRDPVASRLKAAMVGAVLDFPELLADPAMDSHLALLDGHAAQTLAALGRALRAPGAGGRAATGNSRFDAPEFLSEIGALDGGGAGSRLHAFVASRLAAPEMESLEQARQVLEESAARLRKLELERETVETSRYIRERASAWEEEVELAREVAERHRRRLDR